MDKESAVLGLSGAREVQVVVGADHSAMCKIKERSGRYMQIQGNIKRLADKAVASIQGYVPPPVQNPSVTSFSSPPPLPARPPYGGASSPYGAPPANSNTAKITGTLYSPSGSDTRSIRLAELKNKGHWNQAQPLEYEIFQDKLRTLGQDHINTLTTAYELACTYNELGLYKQASEWIDWVINTNKPSSDLEHTILSLKVKSLQGELLESYGDHSGCETLCFTVLTQQQDLLGDDSLDTLETQQRLAEACSSLGRREDALARFRKRVQILERVVGKTHILSIVAKLDLIDATTKHHLGNQYGTAHLDNDVQSAARIVPELYDNLKSALGPKHPVSIRALVISGKIKLYEGENTDASDLLRRALSYSEGEEILGAKHPLTISVVFLIAIMYKMSIGLSFTSAGPPEMRPWLQRTLDWVEERKGLECEDARIVLSMLAMAYMSDKDYVKAEQYYKKLSISYGSDNSQEAQTTNAMLQLCQVNTRILGRGQSTSSSLATLFSNSRFR